jgi:hypothetical protein
MSKLQQVIYIQARSHYGRVDFYPACPQSLLFANIAGTKVIPQRILGFIHLLGYEIKYAPPNSENSEEICSSKARVST